jgi:hypothetical protein
VLKNAVKTVLQRGIQEDGRVNSSDIGLAVAVAVAVDIVEASGGR